MLEICLQNNLLQEQFIDLVNEGNARRLFGEKPCSDFWIEMAQTYPDISKMALKVLIPFPTTYECESAFRHYLPSSQKLETGWMQFIIRGLRCPKRNQT